MKYTGASWYLKTLFILPYFLHCLLIVQSGLPDYDVSQHAQSTRTGKINCTPKCCASIFLIQRQFICVMYQYQCVYQSGRQIHRGIAFLVVIKQSDMFKCTQWHQTAAIRLKVIHTK